MTQERVTLPTKTIADDRDSLVIRHVSSLNYPRSSGLIECGLWNYRLVRHRVNAPVEDCSCPFALKLKLVSKWLHAVEELARTISTALDKSPPAPAIRLDVAASSMMMGIRRPTNDQLWLR